MSSDVPFSLPFVQFCCTFRFLNKLPQKLATLVTRSTEYLVMVLDVLIHTFTLMR